MVTAYIGWSSGSAPTTSFYLYCDRYSQSVEGNYTTLQIYLQAINNGSTSSFSNYPGTQYASIDGIGTVGGYGASPFLPSGYATGAQRWFYGGWLVNVVHAADGTMGGVTLRMDLSYGPSGATGGSFTAGFYDFPRIPRGPRVKVAGVWRNTVAYMRVAGIWKIVVPYVKSAGAWKVGGG